MELLGTLLTGALAGWTAGHLMRGRGYGAVVNVVLGIIGGVIGAQVAGVFGIAMEGWLMKLAMAALGAVVLLTLVDLVRRIG